MTRYLALATALVVLFVGIVAALGGARKPLDVRGGPDAPASATPSPSRDGRATAAGATPAPFDGEAPWALSALPDCYRQLAARRASLAIVRRTAPPPARRLEPGARLATASCELDVGADGVTVRRGADRFRVPGVLAIYVACDVPSGDTLVVVRAGDGLPEFRQYRFRAASVLASPGRGPVALESKT